MSVSSALVMNPLTISSEISLEGIIPRVISSSSLETPIAEKTRSPISAIELETHSYPINPAINFLLFVNF